MVLSNKETYIYLFIDIVIMIDISNFKELINMNFDPYIRQKGFQGSGLSFRKIINDHYIYTLKIQINKYGGSYCVDMGTYIDFIPNLIGDIVKPSKVTPYDCEFRKRLSPSYGSDYWWDYGNSEKECIDNINKMINTFENFGLEYFDQFNSFPNPISIINIQDIEYEALKLKELSAPLDSRLALILARVHQYLGNSFEAINFCNWGLNNNTNGIGLIE